MSIHHIQRRLALNTARLQFSPSRYSPFLKAEDRDKIVQQIGKDIETIENYWPELKQIDGEEPR